MNEVIRVSLKIAYYVLCISPLRLKMLRFFLSMKMLNRIRVVYIFYHLVICLNLTECHFNTNPLLCFNSTGINVQVWICIEVTFCQFLTEL